MANGNLTNTENDIALPSYALRALQVLEDAGHEAWCVGGCVRDALLGRPVHDIDIACNAPWQQTQRAFSEAGFATHETGTDHGTLTVVVEGRALEVTTYRSDGRYADGRHPESVSFVDSIEQDLARRDFTINAIAYHPRRGLCDPLNGLADIKAKTIRTVGDPLDRFREDHLRILRACRFCSELGFAIEARTFDCMVRGKTLMLDLPAERVKHELERLLLSEHVHDALMATVDVLMGIMPELAPLKGFDQRTPYHIYDVLEHTAYVVQYAPATPLCRWTALFHDIGKPAAFFQDNGRGHFFGHARLSMVIAKPIMQRLKFGLELQENVLLLVKLHDATIEPNPTAVKRAIHRHFNDDAELFGALCAIKQADTMAQAPKCSDRARQARQLRTVLDDVISSNQAFSLAQLNVNGTDVMKACSLEPGPEVGLRLNRLLELVIDGRIANERETLLNYIKKDSQ